MAAIGIATARQATEELSETSLPGNRELADWQHRLLPFMRWFVVGLATAFFAFSVWNLDEVNDFIEKEHEPAKEQTFRPATDGSAQAPQVVLETNALDRRYHLRSAVLMSHICTVQLAFIAGIVLALLGAMFIMGKLSETPSNLSGGTSQWNVAITSASPGIILCLLGTVVLLVSLAIHISLPDGEKPVYVSPMGAGSQAPEGVGAGNTKETRARQQQRPDSGSKAQMADQQGKSGN